MSQLPIKYPRSRRTCILGGLLEPRGSSPAVQVSEDKIVRDTSIERTDRTRLKALVVTCEAKTTTYRGHNLTIKYCEGGPKRALDSVCRDRDSENDSDQQTGLRTPECTRVTQPLKRRIGRVDESAVPTAFKFTGKQGGCMNDETLYMGLLLTFCYLGPSDASSFSYT